MSVVIVIVRATFALGLDAFALPWVLGGTVKSNIPRPAMRGRWLWHPGVGTERDRPHPAGCDSSGAHRVVHKPALQGTTSWPQLTPMLFARLAQRSVDFRKSVFLDEDGRTVSWHRRAQGLSDWKATRNFFF